MTSTLAVEVLLGFVVNSDGKIAHAYVIRSSNPWFERAALEALVQWTFRPGRVDGRPVNTRMQVPIFFSVKAVEQSGWTLLLPRDLTKLPAQLRYDSPPVAVQSTFAVYPPSELRERREFKVRAQILLNEQGIPVRTEVPSALPATIAGAARAMVDGWRFKPAERNGKPTPTAVALDIVFSPDGSGAAPVSGATRALLRALDDGTAAVVRGEDLDSLPEPLIRHEAVYPVALRTAGRKGRAVVECCVGPDGEVLLPEVVEATHPDFGYAAVQALATWWFRPPLRDGEPVVVRLRVPFDFMVE